MFKLFRISDVDVVNYYASMFAAKLPSELLGICRAKFLSEFDSIGLFCLLCLTNLFNYVFTLSNLFNE